MAMMKDTGVPWIGQIPADWELGKVKYAFDRKKEKSTEKDPTVLSLARAGVKIRDISTNEGQLAASYEGYNPVEPNDLLLNPMDLVSGANCSISKVSGVISPAYVNLRAKIGFEPRYYDYYFKTQYWNMGLFAHGKGVSFENRWTLNDATLRDYYIPMPRLSEQQIIADYLDEEDSKIDDIIAEANASVEEYKELKQAVIDKYILGFNNIHIKLRQLGSLKNGLNFSHSDEFLNTKFLGVGCFKDNLVLNDVKDFSDEHINFDIPDEYLLINGDIVFVRSNGSKELVGRSVMVDNIDYPLTFSGFCIRFRNERTELVDNRFLLYYFRTTHFKQSLLKYSNDSTNINNLNQEMLNAIRVNAPIVDKQRVLVKKLEHQIGKVDSLIAEKESLINDLEAYKKSLIYEVVTGKRRVV